MAWKKSSWTIVGRQTSTAALVLQRGHYMPAPQGKKREHMNNTSENSLALLWSKKLSPEMGSIWENFAGAKFRDIVI